MNLEELREQAEEQAIEEETVEEVVEVQDELETVEDETEEALESDDFELELDGEEDTQHKPTPEEAIVYKLTKERKKRKKADGEKAELEQRVKELESRLVQPQPQVDPVKQPVVTQNRMPDLFDKGIDGDRNKYDVAVRAYMNDFNSQKQQVADQQTQQQAAQNALAEKSNRLATRASKFITDNKIKPDRVIDAIQTATDEIDSVTGIDGALAHLLDSVGDGSERVAYYLGTNTSAMSNIKALLKEDPNGFKAIAHMTRLTEKLKPKLKNISKAPAPDEAIRGDGSSKSSEALQKLYDNSRDPSELLRLRKKAKALGVELN